MGSRTGSEQGERNIVRESATEIGQGQVQVVHLFRESWTFMSSCNYLELKLIFARIRNMGTCVNWLIIF